MNCLLSGKELKEALSALPSKTVTISEGAVSCLMDGRLHSVRLDTVLPIGPCDPIHIPKPIGLPDGEIEIYTECGITMLNGEPVFSDSIPILDAPPFPGQPHRLSAADYRTVEPFATWNGSTYSDRKPLWYIRAKGGKLQATDSRLLVTIPTGLPDCYIYPQPVEGALEIQVSVRWVRQQSGRYSVIHSYQLGDWPKLPELKGEPSRIVQKLPEGIPFHGHELRRVAAAIGERSFRIELRVDQPVRWVADDMEILGEPL